MNFTIVYISVNEFIYSFNTSVSSKSEEIIMSYEPLNRRVSLLAAILAFLGVILGGIALGTNYWTITSITVPGFNETNLIPTDYEWNVRTLFWFSNRVFYSMMHLTSSRVFSKSVELVSHVHGSSVQ